MNFIQLIIERLRSTNPVLFNRLAWTAAILGSLCQCLFWAHSYLEFAWFTDSLQAMVNDIEFTAFGIFGTSQLTTDSKMLQHETNKLLKK